MKPKALEALLGSIEKWRQIVDGKRIDGGAEDCPLCLIFNNPTLPVDPGCRGCPVRRFSGRNGCAGTPYDEWRDAEGDWVYAPGAYSKNQLAIAQKELDFLISLLPEGEKP